MTHIQSDVRRRTSQLDGTWVNQLGSEVSFVCDAEGRLEGHFKGGAGALAGRRYPIVGSYQPRPVGHSVPLAFVVAWDEAHCVTSWCGHLMVDSGEIRATWLMSTEVDPMDEWKSTVLGHDVFRRAPGYDV